MRQTVTEILRTQTGEPLRYFHKDKNEFLQTQTEEKHPIDEDIICFLKNTSLTGNNEKYQKMYDRFSMFYDLATKIYARLKNGNEKNRIMQYLSLLSIRNGDKVIEISIGTGRNIKYLNPKAEYYGVDISMGMLKRCQKKMKRLKCDITLIQAEAEFLPIKNESFDVLFSAGGFNFFNNPGKAINEMLRIAKNGTKLLIIDETEKLRLRHKRNDFYKGNEIKNPAEYLPDFCRDIEY